MKKFLPQLREMFYELDEDGSGSLEKEELMHADEELQNELKKVMELDNVVDVFDMLDTDGGGSVGIDEFIDGIMKIVCSDRPVELLRIQKHLHGITAKLLDLNKLTLEVL